MATPTAAPFGKSNAAQRPLDVLNSRFNVLNVLRVLIILNLLLSVCAHYFKSFCPEVSIAKGWALIRFESTMYIATTTHQSLGCMRRRFANAARKDGQLCCSCHGELFGVLLAPIFANSVSGAPPVSVRPLIHALWRGPVAHEVHEKTILQAIGRDYRQCRAGLGERLTRQVSIRGSPPNSVNSLQDRADPVRGRKLFSRCCRKALLVKSTSTATGVAWCSIFCARHGSAQTGRLGTHKFWPRLCLRTKAIPALSRA